MKNDNKVKNLLKAANDYYNSIILIIMTLILIIYSQIQNEGIFFIFLYLIAMIMIISMDFFRAYSVKNDKFVIFDFIENKKLAFIGSMIGYSIILLLFWFNTLGSPPQFIIPLIASLDYYLLVSFWLWAAILYNLKKML